MTDLPAMTRLERTLLAIARTKAEAAAEACRLFDGKTKPVGSLGRLEELAARLAAIGGEVGPGRVEVRTRPRAVVVMAADHGVSARGVSAYPTEVTSQMVRNFAAGGAAVNVLARQMEAETVIVDMGVSGDGEWPPGVRRVRIGRGTRDFTVGPAMDAGEARAAIDAGITLAEGLADRGVRVIGTGEMGIGNTTAAAALVAAFTGRPAAEVTGRGTGIDDKALSLKTEVVRRALDRHRPDRSDPLSILSALGGYEIAGLTGLILGAAARRRAIVLDGFITGAAALAASALSPAAGDYLIASHVSAEIGHWHALKALGLQPLFDLGLRLGEGTGALLAMPLLDAASGLLIEMASFESAGVSRSQG